MSRLMNSRRTAHDNHFAFINLALLKKLRDCLDSFPIIDRAHIFGAHALGNAHAHTPMSIAIFGTIDESLLSRVASRVLQSLGSNHPVMLVAYDRADDTLRNHIDTYSIPLYERGAITGSPHSKRARRS